MTEKPLPHSLEAERAVLGAALLSPETIVKVLPVLREAHFFLPQNRLVFRAMEEISAEGRPIDTVLLVDALRAAGKLDAAGGPAYISSLPDGLPRSSNVEYYAAIVTAKARARELIHFASSLESRVWDGVESPDELAFDSIGELLKITGDQLTSGRARQWQEISKSAVEQIATAKANPDKAARMLFGLSDLDDLLAGLRRKEICLIVAPTSNGKTLLASQLATNSCRTGFRALYFSAEMPAEQLAMREIAFRAGVKFYFTQRPETLNCDELERLKEATAETLPLQIADQDVTPSRIWAMAEAMKRTSGLDLLVVDYDQLVIEAGMDLKSDDDSIFRHQRHFILTLKRLTERLDLCAVLLCQLRKVSAKAAGTTPRLDDIWGDSSVRNTPHVIIWLVREFFQRDMDRDYERKAIAYVLKSRNGRTGTVSLDFDPEWVRFKDVPNLEEGHVP
jgi:replicative DNA helicase